MKIFSSARFLVFALVLLAMSASAFGQVSIAIRIGPPAIPVYEQPPCPSEGYLWVPGYWAYNYDYNDYYWVPGTWVLAPQPGYLWTPGYWGWGGDRFIFHEGYWGSRVGFYGGINYGFGYFGNGYEGGRWDHDRFYYNRSVTNVNVTHITNVYNTTVINNNVTRVSYNGGHGGIEARPTREQESVEHERHLPPVAAQTEHVQAARGNPEMRATANHGRPPVAATPRPGALNDHEAVPAREAGAPYNAASNRGENGVPRPPNAVHVKDLPPREKPGPPNTGNAKTDAKYQQQQEKLYAKQEQERQKAQQKQEQDHQKLTRQNAEAAKQQQVEQRHQQQTQQLQEKHTQQQQHLQEKQQPHGQPPQNHGGEPPKH
jgi:hypothetical protein